MGVGGGWAGGRLVHCNAISRYGRVHSLSSLARCAFGSDSVSKWDNMNFMILWSAWTLYERLHGSMESDDFIELMDRVVYVLHESMEFLVCFCDACDYGTQPVLKVVSMLLQQTCPERDRK